MDTRLILVIFVIAALFCALFNAIPLQPKDRTINWYAWWLFCATVVAAVLLLG